MEKEEMFEIIKGLSLDERKAVYEEDCVKIEISRPSILSKRLKDMTIKRIFKSGSKKEVENFVRTISEYL